MMPHRHDELMQREIDGANAPAESAALRTWIGGHPEAQARMEQLRELARALERVPQVEPPPELRPEVMRRIRSRPRPAAVVERWLGALRAAVAPRPALRYACAFLAGGALGAVVVAALGRAPLPGIEQAAATAGLVIDRQAVGLAGVQAEATTARTGGGIVAEFFVRSARDVAVSLEFDGGAFTPIGFDRERGEGADLGLGPGVLRLVHRGEGRYRLSLAANGEARPPLRFRIREDTAEAERALATR